MWWFITQPSYAQGKLSSHSTTTFCADMLKNFRLLFIIITNRTKQLVTFFQLNPSWTLSRHLLQQTSQDRLHSKYELYSEEIILVYLLFW